MSTRKQLTVLLAAVAASVSGAKAATYVYTPTNTSENWSAGTNWSATPASGTDTTLVFASDTTTAFLNGLANTNTNNVADPFSLNVLTLNGKGPASGAGTITIAGSQLNLVSNGSVTPVVNLNAAKGSAGLTYNVNTPLALTNNTRITGNGDATFNFGAALSGSASLTKAGSSTLNLNADSSSTYSGNITLEEGMLRVNSSGGSIAKLSDSTILNFNGGGVFSAATSNAGGSIAYNQGLAQVNFQAGYGTLDTSRPNGTSAKITVASWTRSVGATANVSISGGSVGSNSQVILTGQGTGFISQGMFYGSNYAYYDTGNYVRGMAYTNPDTQSVAGDGTASSSIATADLHTQITAATGSPVAYSSDGAKFDTTVTLASAGTFQVGQTLVGTGIVKGTYITNISGSTLTLSQPLSANAAGNYTPYTGINNQDTITLKTLKLGSQGTSLRLASGKTLTLSDGGIIYDGNNTVAAVISGGTGIQAGSGKELVINTASSINNHLVIATPILNNGTNALVKTGIGLLQLDASNTVNGGIYVNQGRLDVMASNTVTGGIKMTGNSILNIRTTDANGLGAATSTNKIISQGNNTIGLQTANTVLANDIEVTSGTLYLYAGLASSVGGGNGAVQPVYFTGNINLQDGASIEVRKPSGSGYPYLGNNGTSLLSFGAGAGSSTTVTLDGYGSGSRTHFGGFSTSTVTGSGPRILNKGSNSLALNVTVAAATSYTYAGTIEDNTSLTKLGDGTQVLSGANTYTDGTSINGGMLKVNNTSGSGTGSGAVSIASGAALGGSGSISGTVAVNGSIQPGNSIGTLTVANDVTWNAGNAWVFELGAGGPSLASLGTSDLLAITGSGSDFIKGSGSTFTFDFAGTGAAGWYKLVDWDGTTGFVAGDFFASNLSPSVTSATFTVDLGTSALYLQVIPEPTMVGALAMGAVALLARRARRNG